MNTTNVNEPTPKQVLDAFADMETVIVKAIEGYSTTAPESGQDLSILTAVFAKLICAAALTQGRSEEEFLDALRETYKLMALREKQIAKNTH